MKKGQEEVGGEEVEEEEDSCTLAVWEERVDWERRQPPWQETPIQYSSLEATVEQKESLGIKSEANMTNIKFSKTQVQKQLLRESHKTKRKPFRQRDCSKKLKRKEGEITTK